MVAEEVFLVAQGTLTEGGLEGTAEDSVPLGRLGDNAATPVNNRWSDTTTVQTFEKLARRWSAVYLFQSCAARIRQLIWSNTYHAAIVMQMHITNAPCEVPL